MDIIEALCQRFKSGETEKKYIGLELEHFVMTDNKMPLSYSNGVEKILNSVSSRFDEIHKENGKILAMKCGGYSVSVEPGAQLEVSVKPCENVHEIEKLLDSFYSDFEPVVKEAGGRFVNVGALSPDIPDKTEMIPKKRYEFMDEYFKTSGTMGRYMMRSSASTQVSVDYEDEADFINKFRTAYLLTPFLALYSAKGTPGEDSYLKRIDIWNNVDNDRTLPPRDLFDDSFGYESYAKHIANTPVIFINSDKGYTYTGNMTVADAAKIYGTDENYIEHYLSMVFPDVRLKGFMEIRIADSMDRNKALEYCRIVSNIMYSKKAVSEIQNRYRGVNLDDIKKAKLNVRKFGGDASVYNRRAKDELDFILKLAGVE